MIRAIIFDLGGVLIDLDRTACVRSFLDLLGYQRITEILDASHSRGPYMELEAGHITPEEFRSLILADSRPGARAEDVDRSMRAFLGTMEPAKARLIERLHGKYDLYILSNNNPISMARTWELFRECGIEKAFSGQFISWEMQLMKPSAACFEEVVRRIGIPAGEILFIDDSEANVRAARSCGLQARYYIPGTELSLLLADL